MILARIATLGAVVVLVGAAACGGSDDKKDASGSNAADETTTTTTTPGSVGATGNGATPPGGEASQGGPGAPGGGPGGSGGTGGGTTTTTAPLPLTIELSSACVRPGGTQQVTVRSVPNAAAGYDTTWSDGKNGLTGGYGGTANGRVDESGTWTSSFTVGPNAPPGKATTTAVAAEASGRTAQATADFTVSGVTGTCP